MSITFLSNDRIIIHPASPFAVLVPAAFSLPGRRQLYYPAKGLLHPRMRRRLQQYIQRPCCDGPAGGKRRAPGAQDETDHPAMHLRCKHTICTIKATAEFVNSFAQISRFFGKDRKESRFFVEDAGNSPICSEKLIFALFGAKFYCGAKHARRRRSPPQKNSHRQRWGRL